MRVKYGLGVAVAAGMAFTAFAPSANAMPAPRHLQPAITQSYTCHTPVGDETEALTVTGKASIKGIHISLKKVVYSITNTFGVDLTVEAIKVSVPDPTIKVAKYTNGSAKAAKKPAGYKGGHGATGVYALHAGQLDVANGDTIKTAALSAKYKATGSPGSEVDFQPGDVSFTVDSPISGQVSCTPDKPVGIIASVTE